MIFETAEPHGGSPGTAAVIPRERGDAASHRKRRYPQGLTFRPGTGHFR